MVKRADLIKLFVKRCYSDWCRMLHISEDKEELIQLQSKFIKSLNCNSPFQTHIIEVIQEANKLIKKRVKNKCRNQKPLNLFLIHDGTDSQMERDILLKTMFQDQCKQKVASDLRTSETQVRRIISLLKERIKIV